MDITYNFSSIYVDDYTYNEHHFSNVIQRVLNNVNVNRDYFFTPSEIIFHRCTFKDTIFTIFNNDTITLNNDTFIYLFNNAVSKFKGEYPLNITVKLEYCYYFSCSWNLTFYPSYIPIYDTYHNKIGILSVFIEYNKLAYDHEEAFPTYPCNLDYGYKILREKISSHVTKYHLAKLSLPNNSEAMFTIAGEIRTKKVKVEKIIPLVEVNSYNYADEVLRFPDHTDINSVVHIPFSGLVNESVLYEVGNILSVDEMQISSFECLGKGIYLFSNPTDAIRYLNRVVVKDKSMIVNEDGSVTILSKYLLDTVDILQI